MSDIRSVSGRGDARVEPLLHETEERLRRHNQVLVELAKRQAIHGGNLTEAIREITESAARTLELERVSVWFFSPDRKSLRCFDLYERSPNRHSSGMEVTAIGNPAYFRALESERSIAANDAQHDPRTQRLLLRARRRTNQPPQLGLILWRQLDRDRGARHNHHCTGTPLHNQATYETLH